MAKVLIAGESWMMHTIHVKGFDSFTTSAYAEGVDWLRSALLAAGHQVHFMPNHEANAAFPGSAEAMAAYDVVILSDIGTNTLLIHPDTFGSSKSLPNRLGLIRDFADTSRSRGSMARRAMPAPRSRRRCRSQSRHSTIESRRPRERFRGCASPAIPSWQVCPTSGRRY